MKTETSMLEHHHQQQWLWNPKERNCLALLQRSYTRRSSLLQIQAFMLRNSLQTNVNLFTKLIMACVSLVEVQHSDPLSGIKHARKLFDHRSQTDDTFLCNSMIKAYTGTRQFSESYTLYKDLRRNTDFIPDNYTYTALVKSCGLGKGIWEGLEIHCHVIKFGVYLDLYVSTAMVDLYAKVGKMDWATKVFDEMPERSHVSWTVLICGYVRSGKMKKARKVFDEMHQSRDSVIYNAMIDGYVKLGEMISARSLFDEMPDKNVVSWTSLIHGYCCSGDVVSAKLLFDTMPEKNVFSWNSMIGGYCRNKQPHEALRLFQEMQSSTMFEPDQVTIVSVLPAIADLGALELGEWVHRFAWTRNLNRSVGVCTALVDMYSKCGEIEKARRVFDEMPEKEVASWNALINGYAINGHVKEALEAFTNMRKHGMKPDEITLIGVLSACNHGGFVDEGKIWFKAMGDFGITPTIVHYGCMVDLLGRAGHVEEAESLIMSMPYEVNEIITSSFLSACGYTNDVTRAERMLKKAVVMEPRNDGNYVLLRNLYALEKRWDDVELVKGLMRKNGAKKEVGCSVIEVDCMVWEFVAGDVVHPQMMVIQSVLKHLWIHMGKRPLI